MATNNDDFMCSICRQLYKTPVVHIPCGVSFDLECITGKICPTQECRKVIKQEDLIINYTLKETIRGHPLLVEEPVNYYIFLLDVSKSMWYSDSLLPFLMGKSRFTYAIQFLADFFKSKRHALTDKISLFTFDTAPLQRFDFSVIDDSHIEMLQSLKCEGKDTALFDSIDRCLERFEQMRAILGDKMQTSYLIILTDGGNNFGSQTSEHARHIAIKSKALQISGHMVQIGDTDRKKTRVICDFIRYKFNHFKGGNTREFTNSLINSINTETRARVQTSRTRPQLDASVVISNQAPHMTDTMILKRLPDVPETSVKVPPKQQIFA